LCLVVQEIVKKKFTRGGKNQKGGLTLLSIGLRISTMIVETGGGEMKRRKARLCWAGPAKVTEKVLEERRAEAPNLPKTTKSKLGNVEKIAVRLKKETRSSKLESRGTMGEGGKTRN